MKPKAIAIAAAIACLAVSPAYADRDDGKRGEGYSQHQRMKDAQNTAANGMGIATAVTRIAMSDLSPAITRRTTTTGTAGTRTESTTANTSERKSRLDIFRRQENAAFGIRTVLPDSSRLRGIAASWDIAFRGAPS